MLPSRRALSSLLSASTFLLTCGASSAFAPNDDPPHVRAETAEPSPSTEITASDVGTDGTDGVSLVEAGPDGIRVETPGALVEIDSESYVLVCVNGVRVVVRAGEAPPCRPRPGQPEAPEPEPPASPGPGTPAPETPAPEKPAPETTVPGVPDEPGVPEEPGERSPEPGTPTAAPSPVPTAPAQEHAAVSEEPSASPSAPSEVNTVVREQILADTSQPSAQQTSGAFTPMRTMVVLMVVIAVAAGGAGRAATRSSG